MKFWEFIRRSDLDSHLMLTRHEDREITPGVPDLHYIPTGPGDFRVGWLELKAQQILSPSKRIEIQPSQHQYFRAWGPKMPIHFLIRIGSTVYLVPSSAHMQLAVAGYEYIVESLAELVFADTELVSVLAPYLTKVTSI